jgi:hypothetical protein
MGFAGSWKRMLFCLAAACAAGCVDDTPAANLLPAAGPAMPDDLLKQLIVVNSTWKYFENRTTPFARSSAPSPHTEPLLVVRYNVKAATHLDGFGRVAAGAFPDSSIVVMELSDGTAVTTYAAMMKLPNSASAGAGGWAWGEYAPGGNVRTSTSTRGASCSSCHSTGVDFTRMNGTH